MPRAEKGRALSLAPDNCMRPDNFMSPIARPCAYLRACRLRNV